MAKYGEKRPFLGILGSFQPFFGIFCPFFGHFDHLLAFFAHFWAFQAIFRHFWPFLAIFWPIFAILSKNGPKTGKVRKINFGRKKCWKKIFSKFFKISIQLLLSFQKRIKTCNFEILKFFKNRQNLGPDEIFWVQKNPKNNFSENPIFTNFHGIYGCIQGFWTILG